MSTKAKNLRKRLSLQNQNLGSNKLSLMAANMGIDKIEEEEKEVTQEEDPLKFFSQQQRKKEKKQKEEEAKKYLKPIIEEEDPLKYFENNKKIIAEDEDPENFVKKKDEKASDDLPKIMGKMLSLEYDEKNLAEKILKRDIPEEIIIENLQPKKTYSMEERKKKMEKRAKTSLRLSQRQGFQAVAKDKLLERLQNYKNNNVVKANDNIKNIENKKSGNTLLSAEEQVNVNKNNNTIKERKDIDLSNFMKKKDEKK